jgi:Flp pilus assembly protein TadD
MNRLLATTAAAALCAAWSMGTSAWADADATTPVPAADSAAQPKTLQDAINVQVVAAKNQRLQGHLDEAAKAFVQLMLVAPNDPAVLGEYGKTLAQQGHSRDAVVLLTRAVTLQTGDWTYYSALGVAYDQLGKRKEAREAYDRALALKPGEPSVLNNYALSRMLAGDYAGSRKMFEQIEAMGTNDPKIAANLAKLDTLEGAHGQRTAASDIKTPPAANFVPAHSAPVAVATLASPAPKGGVMMERVPVDPLAGPVGKIRPAHAPAAVANAVPAPVTARANTVVAEKINPATTVMEKVPSDPLAGPVGKREATHAPLALASAAPKPAVKTPAPDVKTAVAEKINPATTMMERVPADPLAGPVAPHVVAAIVHKKPVVKVAHAAAPRILVAAKPQTPPKPKTVLAKAALSPPPALRTASDN